MAPTVLVVEDSDFTRMLMESTVRGLDYPVHAVTTPNEAMRAAREHPIDVALVDLDLGDGPTGADLALGLRRIRPRLGLVILTSYEDPRLMGNLPDFPPGTRYVTKQALGDLGSLRDLIDEAAAEPLLSPDAPPELQMTDGQLEILRLVAAGHGNAEIARMLWITPSAVEKAIHRLARSLGLDEAAAANKRVLIAQEYFRRSSGGHAPRA